MIETIWEQYSEFKDRVIKEVKPDLSLRDKDRYSWGKSFVQQLEKDIKNCFSKNS